MHNNIISIPEKTFIVNYGSLLLGGIEKYIVNMMEYCKKNNYRIIWIKHYRGAVAKDFEEIIDSKVETIIGGMTRYSFFKCAPIHFAAQEKVTIVSFGMVEYVQSEIMKKKFTNQYGCDVKNFYMIPHYTGNLYYIERWFHKPFRNVVWKFMKKIAKKMDENGSVLFFSKQHIKPFYENYQLTPYNPDERILKGYFTVPDYDAENVKLRSERTTFNIISVGRFDFPHKGYLMGLIKTFSKMKKQYPQLSLYIVGMGKDELKVMQTINQLSTEVAESIHMLGGISPLKTRDLFRTMHLNISSEGAVRDGAIQGIISLPCRQYSMECEVYGFLPDSLSMTLSKDKGYPVENYIRKCIEMSQEEFCARCKDGYEAYNATYDVDPEFIFKQYNKSEDAIISDLEIATFKLITLLYTFKNRFAHWILKKQVTGTE
ncbi:MAG: hypothetical protein RR576_07940 [Oscillospiraceae bacterium]